MISIEILVRITAMLFVVAVTGMVGVAISKREKKPVQIVLTQREKDKIEREAMLITPRECPQCDRGVRYDRNARCIHCGSQTILPMSKNLFGMWYSLEKKDRAGLDDLKSFSQRISTHGTLHILNKLDKANKEKQQMRIVMEV